MTEDKPKEVLTPTPRVDDLRAKIFSADSMRFKRVPLNFKGVELEIKQPTLDQIQALQQFEGSKSRAVYLLVHLGFVPGTDVHVFTDADMDQLAAMPYGPEFTKLQNIFTGFLIGDVKDEEKNLEATSTSTTPTQ